MLAGSLSLLRGLAPVPGRQRAVLLPRPAGHVQATVAVPRDAQEADRRRFGLAQHGQRELPPQPLDQSAATLGLDRVAELLVDRANLRRSCGRVVADGGQPEQVARQLRTLRVQDERAADAERAAEESGLEHHVVARRRLAGLGRIRRCPVVLGEHECGEVDLLGELDKPVEGGPPRVERGRPGLDVGDVLEPARDRLEQFGLLARRSEEDARLVHARFVMTDMAHTLRRVAYSVDSSSTVRGSGSATATEARNSGQHLLFQPRSGQQIGRPGAAPSAMGVSRRRRGRPANMCPPPLGCVDSLPS